MSKFQLGLMIGFFLGALVTFVALGIIYLYFEERQKKRAEAGKRAADRKISTASWIPASTHSGPSHRLPAFAPEEQLAEEEVVIYYLFILIE
jgi:hypothetical protein